MKIGIVGAGVAGLTAAYELAHLGHKVTVYEAATQAGGLASGFRDPRWDWSLERFYHHLFQTDDAILRLVDTIGFGDKLFFRSPVTAQWWNGKGYPLAGALPDTMPALQQLPLPGLVTSGLAVLGFPGLPFVDRVRLSLLMAYLKFGVRDWHPLEQTTAAAWTQRWGGERLYRGFFKPLLEGKFGPYTEAVNMSWLWARFKTRTVQLGYFTGGFQSFADALAAYIERMGVVVRLGTPITAAVPEDSGRWTVAAAGNQETFDALIVTGSPQLLGKLVPQLPPTYLGQLTKLRSMGAVVMTLALTQPLTKELYWINMPKDQFPFLALVEHTNFISPEHYGGDHLVYCGDYLDPDHEYFRLGQDELLDRFVPALQQVNPAFTRDWIRTSWLHRERYAQPIVPVNHSQHIPPLHTPLPGLYWASMSQVYPWDRGTNFAVELGQHVAETLQRHQGKS